MSMNRVILVGRVGQDPEIKSFDNGRRMATFSLATSERWRDKSTGERREKTQWHRVRVMSDGLIRIVENYVRRGGLVGVEGAMEYREWEGQDGSKRKAAEVVLKGFDGRLSLLGDGGGGRPSSGQQDYGRDLDDEIPF
ncbi:single-stranded DNA-binding protein [Amorphus sp. 3PC139-8]|uniref:single-stranded DNA-binding protein n=1 Tax=Amorphus sp. 3PC139-8 TaxID=2735676 RepID=UPI00345D3EFA